MLLVTRSIGFVAAIIVAISTLSLHGCTTVNSAYDPSKKHHLPQGFQNNYIANIDVPRGDLFKWQYEAWRNGLPKPPQTPTAEVAADMAFIRANVGPTQQPAITWVGHATMLVQMAGMNVLTDPVFSQRASPVQFAGPKRAQAPGIALADLPKMDVVVISHNHYDHLDTASVLALNAQAGGPPLFLVPLGVKAWFASQGITNVREMDWWDVVRLPSKLGVGEFEVHFTPVQHWSARGLGDRRATLWGGYAMIAPDFHAYFSGDTGYSKDFVDTQARFAPRQTPALGGGFDVALIAVGAYEPRWFMKNQHVNPAEAVQIHKDLGAKRSVGVHWGTFNLTDESLDQPPKDLAQARLETGVTEDQFGLMAIGQTKKLPKRPNPVP